MTKSDREPVLQATHNYSVCHVTEDSHDLLTSHHLHGDTRTTHEARAMSPHLQCWVFEQLCLLLTNRPQHLTPIAVCPELTSDPGHPVQVLQLQMEEETHMVLFFGSRAGSLHSRDLKERPF